MLGTTKTYQVDYLIKINDQASASLATMAQNAQNLAKPLQEFKTAITQVKSEMDKLKRDWSGALTIKPTVDTITAGEQLANLEKLAKQSANRIATMMDRAFVGNGPKKPTKNELKKAIADKEALRDSGVLFKAEKQKIQKEITELNEQLYNLGRRKPKTTYNTLSALSTFAKDGNNMKTAASAVKSLKENINGFDAKKLKIQIGADITPALTSFNKLLATIRETVVSVPVAITNANNQANKGKSKTVKTSDKTSKALATDVKKIANNSATILNKELQKKQNSVSIKMKLDKTGMVSQLNTIVAELKEKANAKPIKLKTTLSPIGMVKQFNQIMGEFKAKSVEKPLKLQVMIDAKKAVLQLEKVIGTLQELANTKPILLNASASTTATAATDDKKAKGKNAPYATPAQISAYEKQAADMAKLRMERDAQGAKLRAQERNKYLAQQQQMYEALWSRETLHNQWTERDKAGQSTRAKNNAARQARETRNAISAARHNQAELARIHSLRSQELFAPLMSGETSKIDKVTKPARVAANQSALARMKASWYSFTGNTSFGARTPMAVDMAKGMGTMFAIGGAMSAVGSSLSQSVNYQNIMKTTQAILENGTKNYSDGGFKEMEHVVRQVGKETKFTAPQVASAAKFLAMAGYDIPSIKSAINPVANIALIGDTNLGETADKLTNVMTTFGINPEKMSDIADIMTSTFTRSNTDMMMLAESAKYAGGIAHMYGGSFQNNFSDVMAMFGVLGNAGIQASSAGTTLRMMYQNLMQPNKNQKKTLAHYGIATRNASGAPLEMAEIIKQIYQKVPKEQLADAVGNMFRITAQPGAAALVQAIGTGKLGELIEENRKAAGTGVAQKIADEKKNTLSGLWAQVESTFTEGILQAVENRQGGWAAMLGQLRDFLAKPETVEILSSIIDLVEQLMKIMKDFAQMYAQIYHAFPNLINFWMRFQLWATQIGFLVAPVIQLMTVFDKFKTTLFGVAAATTAATAAENGRRVVTGGSAAATLLGGAASGVVGRTAQARSSSLLKGLVAANIAGGLVPYKGFVPYNQVIGYTSRPDILGPLSLTRNQNRFSPQIAEQIKTYERSRGYMWRGMSKHQKRQLNRTIDNQITRLKASSVYVPSILPLSFGLGNKPIYRHGREITKGISYYRAGVSQVMPFHQYSARTGSVLAGTAAQADKAAMYRWRSQKWGTLSASQTLSAEQRAMAAARSEKYLNAAIEAEALRQEQMIAQQKASRARIAQISAARHASRGPIDSVVRNRFAQRYGFNRAAKMTLSNSFSAGRALGTLSLVSMLGGIKTMALSLFSGLAKAIGLLVSPVGLAVAALSALGFAIYKSYQAIQIRYENLKLAEENSKWADEANRGVMANYIETGAKVGGFSAIQVGYAKQTEKAEKTFSLSNSIANALADDDKMEGLVGSEIVNKYASGFKYLPQSYINDFKKNNPDYEDSYNPFLDTIVTSANEKTVGNARKLGMIAQWGQEAAKQADVVQAMEDLQEAMVNKDAKRVKDILDAYTPTSQYRMSDMKDAAAIQAITDPTKYREWQEVQFNVLNDLVKNMQSPLLHYSNAMDLLKQYGDLNEKERKNYDVSQLGQMLVQSIPVAFNGTTAAISLDEMGRINWAELARSVNNNIPFTVAQQQEILNNMYKAIYNDPNIKNCTSIIDLLQNYLPQIANARSPYDEGGRFQTWDEANPSVEIPKKEDNPAGILARSNASINLPKFSDYPVHTYNVPMWSTDFDRTLPGKGFLEKDAAYRQKYPERFPETASSVKNITVSKTTRNGSSGGGSYSPSDDKKKQKDYASTYGRNSAKPTQVIINIDNLARFDRTTIAGDSNERAIATAMETKIAEAVSMLSAQILTSASSAISQGLS